MNEPTRADLEQWDREHYWHAFTQMARYEPLIFERAHGCRLVDLDGREYLDGVSSLWCNLLGHRHRGIDAAIRAQLEKVAHVTSLGASNPTSIRLARRLAELAPGGLRRVFFSDDGATSVEVALKMAFQYWQQRADPRPRKTRFVALGNAYHGDTLGSVSVGGVERFHAMFGPLLFDALRLPAPSAYRTPDGVGRDDACRHYLDQAESLLAVRHEEIAALVMEPLVQGAAGIVMHPPGYLAGIRELTRKHDVLLIADEVAVGMGRTGTLFACEQEDVVPDLVCMAKGLTGGYLPLAATIATDEIWNAFLGDYADSKQFFHGHTYGGNPLGAAAALATLEAIDKEHVLEQLPAKVDRLAGHLARLAEHPHVGDARQRGLIGAVELVCDKTTREPFPWAERIGQQVCDAAIRRGVWLRPLGHVVVIMPPLIVTLDELDTIMEAVAAGVAEVLGGIA